MLCVLKGRALRGLVLFAEEGVEETKRLVKFHLQTAGCMRIIR